jgi:uncharacterized membrane protein
VFAELNSTPYKIMLLIHILGAIVAFGAAFVNPLVYRLTAKAGAGAAVAAAQARAITRVTLPAMLITGLIGFGISGMSKIPGTDELQFRVSQGWISAAVALWIVQVALYFFVILPGERKVASGEEAAASRVSAATGASHLLLLVILYLMIWKPGL